MFADLRQDEKTFYCSIAEGDPRSRPFLAGAGATPNPNLSSRTKTILALLFTLSRCSFSEIKQTFTNAEFIFLTSKAGKS